MQEKETPVDMRIYYGMIDHEKVFQSLKGSETNG